MYFGEYLVEKKVIKEEQLINALFVQVEQLPSLLRVVSQSKIFSSNEILNIVNIQYKSKKDFISVLKNDLNVSDEVINKIYKIQFENRKTIGQILVELGFTEESVIEKMLIEFLQNKGNLNSTVIPEAGKELGESSERNIFVDEYLNKFDDKLNNKIIKIIEFINEAVGNESNSINYINSLYKDLYTLKGAATLAELNISAGLLDKWVQALDILLKKDGVAIINTRVLEINKSFNQALNCLWEFRLVVKKEGKELGLEINPVWKTYTECVELLSALN